ncbi:hypothetical protein OJAV_G00130590 [Oryzias javanicus]|uniref:Uncharacterized protein n=1 Tax=Oryzias javanicus TaxID=123683 RepID=A0A3S2PMN2_ORYJA|nr:hypothetical protein OJAV_G00130590 [Oryzias javanicus]
MRGDTSLHRIFGDETVSRVYLQTGETQSGAPADVSPLRSCSSKTPPDPPLHLKLNPRASSPEQSCILKYIQAREDNLLGPESPRDARAVPRSSAGKTWTTVLHGLRVHHSTQRSMF